MPHFIIECSENVLEMISPADLMGAVYEEAESTGLFAAGDLKVRITPYRHYKLGEGKDAFVHVLGEIMQGRTIAQRADLSRSIITRLKTLLPNIAILSMNVVEFERATYCNKSLIHPDNTQGDRHFLL